MNETLDVFFKNVSGRLRLICEGRYEATDEVLKYSDTTQNSQEVCELAETVGLMSVKLEAREMALEQTIKELEQNNSERRQFGLFFILFTVFISVFTFISAYLNRTGLTTKEVDLFSSMICLGFMMFLILLSFIYVYLSPFTMQAFGLTFRGSGRAIAESLLATLPVVLIITLIRYLCIGNVAFFQDKPFFVPYYADYAFWLYIFVAPGQEFIARGVTQTLIFRMIGGRNAVLWSIILGSVIFAVTHTYFSFWISVLSMFGGFLWGWLYVRHQTIVGISISHFIIGNYMGMTGFWAMLM